MPYALIAKYSLYALAFGLAAGGLWLLLRRLRGAGPLENRGRITLAMVVYIAMLAEIIALRLGLQPVRWLNGIRPKLRPLQTTLETWQIGPGSFVYNLLGNLLWFVPLGALLRRLRPGLTWWGALLAGALLSLALEFTQFLLGTGTPDVDDVLYNSLGALLGYLLFSRDAA